MINFVITVLGINDTSFVELQSSGINTNGNRTVLNEFSSDSFFILRNLVPINNFSFNFGLIKVANVLLIFVITISVSCLDTTTLLKELISIGHQTTSTTLINVVTIQKHLFREMEKFAVFKSILRFNDSGCGKGPTATASVLKFSGSDNAFISPIK